MLSRNSVGILVAVTLLSIVAASTALLSVSTSIILVLLMSMALLAVRV